MAKYGFDLQRKNKKKKFTMLICVFLCFTVVLGSVSFLLLWRSLNYDFNNIFKKEDDSSTAPATTQQASEVVFEGEYRFLVAVTSDDGKQTRFINLIDVNLGDSSCSRRCGNKKSRKQVKLCRDFANAGR